MRCVIHEGARCVIHDQSSCPYVGAERSNYIGRRADAKGCHEIPDMPPVQGVHEVKQSTCSRGPIVKITTGGVCSCMLLHAPACCSM